MISTPVVLHPVGYVGLGTVSAATWWYLFDEDGPQVSFYQLVSLKKTPLCVSRRSLISTVRFFHLHGYNNNGPFRSQQSPEIAQSSWTRVEPELCSCSPVRLER